MQVTERMQALGDHAKSSRQPPLKDRKSAKTDASAAKQNVIDETILESSVARDSAVAVIVDDVTPQIVVRENGDGVVPKIASDAIAEITSSRVAGATEASAAAGAKLQPEAADGSATQASRSRKTTTPARRNARSFTSGKTGRHYTRMNYAIRMSRSTSSGIWRRKSRTFGF